MAVHLIIVYYLYQYILVFARRIGDRIGIAPTGKTSSGHGEAFTIIGIDKVGSLMLDKMVNNINRR